MRRLALLLTILAAPAPARAGYDFLTLDAPGAVATSARGINDAGQVVGDYQEVPFGPTAGFLLAGGSYSPIRVPGASVTLARGIGNSGVVVGAFGVGAPTDGFVLQGGSYSTLRALPRATAVADVNSSGQLVGSGVDAQGRLAGFIGDRAGGFSRLSFAGGADTAVNGIDDAGHLVGQYADPAGSWHGFLDGATLDAPGAAWTIANGVNGLGQVVGQYADAAGVRHGFLLAGGAYTTLDVPDAASTGAFGINGLGQIVGEYVDEAGARHGFLAIPVSASVPEPAAAGLLLMGAAATLSGARWRRRSVGTDPLEAGAHAGSP